jgi:hypothetical protein
MVVQLTLAALLPPLRRGFHETFCLGLKYDLRYLWCLCTQVLDACGPSFFVPRFGDSGDLFKTLR